MEATQFELAEAIHRVVQAANTPLLRRIEQLERTVEQLRRKKYSVIHSHEEAAFFCQGLANKYGLVHIYDMHSSLPQQLSNFSAFNVAPFRLFFEKLENRPEPV